MKNLMKKNNPKKIPEFFRSLLWSYDFKKLDPERDRRTIVVQTLNYGLWQHWQWINKAYGRKELQRIIKRIPASEFRPSALMLAQVLFGIRNLQYASRGTYIRKQKTLAKT